MQISNHPFYALGFLLEPNIEIWLFSLFSFLTSGNSFLILLFGKILPRKKKKNFNHAINLEKGGELKSDKLDNCWGL